MGTIITDIQENTFSAKASPSYYLSILLGRGAYSYLISDAQQNLLVLKSKQFDYKSRGPLIEYWWKEDILADTLLKSLFREVKVAVVSNKFTLIPDKFFDHSKLSTYLENVAPVRKNEEVLSNLIPDIEAANVFVIEKKLLEFIRSNFVNAHILHATTSFISGTAKIAKNHSDATIYINLAQESVLISLYQGSDLIFSNVFHPYSATDCLYYLMLVFDQFRLKPESIPVYLSGKINKESEVYNLFFRYVRNLNFMPFSGVFRKGPNAGKVPAHYYFDLFSMTLCE